MDKKILVPTVIIAVLLVILLLLNFVLPNIGLPSSQNEEVETPQQEIKINEVSATPEGFSPISIVIQRGDTVRFINNSGGEISINSNPHPANNLWRFLNLGIIPDGSAAQVEITEPGSYGYHNHLNPDQKGTIVVE